MSGYVSPFLSANDLLAPDEFWRRSRATDAAVADSAMQRQGEQQKIDMQDLSHVANIAGYLKTLPEDKRALAYESVYSSLPDHMRARAPSSYQGHEWLEGVYGSAISAKDRWERQQNVDANKALLGGDDGTAPAPGGGSSVPGLAVAESGNKPGVVNPGGYAGTYQMGKARLKDLGFYTPAPGEDMTDNTTWAGKVQIAPFNVTDRASFLRTPAAQEAVQRASEANVDQAIAGTPGADRLNRNGLQAVAHLGGVAGMQRFVSSGGAYDPADANGTHLSDYYRKFSGGGGAPARGVAARTGGMDVAGPGAPTAPAAPDSVMSPDVRSRTMALAGSPPNALAAPPGTVGGPMPGPADVAPPQAAPPAAPQATAPQAAPAIASAEQVAAQLQIDRQGLTPDDRQRLKVLADTGVHPDKLLSVVESMRQHNEARVTHELTQQHQQVTDAREAEKAQQAREKADRERVDANRPYQGNSPEAQAKNILIEGSQPGGDTSSTKYQDAWATLAYKETEGGGATISRDMSMFKPPTEKGGRVHIPPPPTVTSGASQQFAQANTLRDEFAARTKTFPDVQIAYENIQEAAKSNNGAGDMSLLYSYIRLLDPNTGVKEGEYQSAGSAGSWGQRISGAFDRVISGGRLPDSLRKDFIHEAGILYKNRLRDYEQMAGVYTDLAKRSNLDPERVVTRITRPQASDTPQFKEGQTATGPKGEKVIFRNGQFVPQ